MLYKYQNGHYLLFHISSYIYVCVCVYNTHMYMHAQTQQTALHCLGNIPAFTCLSRGGVKAETWVLGT